MSKFVLFAYFDKGVSLNRIELLLPLAIISWCVVLKNQVSVGWCTALFAYIGTIFSILTICFLIVSISKKLIPKASPYKIFAISVSIIGVLTFLYAIYDIKTSTGLFAGLFGTVLLITVVPITLALLLIEFLIWIYNKKKETKNGKK